jgi:hypothetical protein
MLDSTNAAHYSSLVLDAGTVTATGGGTNGASTNNINQLLRDANQLAGNDGGNGFGSLLGNGNADGNGLRASMASFDNMDMSALGVIGGIDASGAQNAQALLGGMGVDAGKQTPDALVSASMTLDVHGMNRGMSPLPPLSSQSGDLLIANGTLPTSNMAGTLQNTPVGGSAVKPMNGSNTVPSLNTAGAAANSGSSMLPSNLPSRTFASPVPPIHSDSLAPANQARANSALTSLESLLPPTHEHVNTAAPIGTTPAKADTNRSGALGGLLGLPSTGTAHSGVGMHHSLGIGGAGANAEFGTSGITLKVTGHEEEVFGAGMML